tara:strand:+ start:13758 stop:14399 length:642 start_codon:yes stop_codon:yes gene_type:complete
VKEEFWMEKWNREDIGFHQQAPNSYLQEFGTQFFEAGKTVLVPLCGASIDMKWLKDQGLNIVGVELSEKATQWFFETHNLELKITELDGFKIYESENIKIYTGDIFTFKDWDNIDYVYDRASIVALPKDMREQYVSLINKNLSHTSIFMISFSFDNEELGPPFSVDSEKIKRYFSDLFEIERVKEVRTENPPIHGGVLPYIKDSLYFLNPKVK